MTQRFVRRYREIFSNSVPRATAALTYDAILLLADAARRVGTLQGDSLARAIAQTERYEGAGSTYRFAGRQDPRRGGVLLLMGRGRDSLISISADRP